MREPFLPLEAFCHIGSGSTPPRAEADRYFGGEIPWVKSGELREQSILHTEEHVTTAALNETAVKLVPKGAILVAMYGATIGRVGILGIEATTNQAICHIVPDPEKAETRYLFHALRGCLEAFLAKGVGGAQPNISQQIIKQTSIYLPSLPEQRRIAAILDQADALRAKRRQTLTQLDELTSAMFMEEFGDLVDNPFSIKTVQLSDVCHRVTDGTHQPPKWSPTGLPFLFVKNIVDGEINFETERYISAETQLELTRRCLIEVGDILFSTVGSYGVPALVRERTDFAFQRHIAHIKPNRDLIDPEFLCVMLASKGLRAQSDRAARGAAQKTVNLGDLKTFMVFLPPIDKQQSFVSKIRTQEKLLSLKRLASSIIDSLFVSLQHRAFRGEL